MIMQKQRFHSQAGFTLLEVLIAVMLMAIIMTTLFAVFTHVLDAAQHARTRMKSDRIGRTILTIIAEDIRYIQPQLVSDRLRFSISLSSDLNFLPEEKSVLSFPTTSTLKFTEHTPSCSLQYVTYSLVKNTSGAYSLFRTEQPFPSIHGTFTPLRYELTDTIRTCTFSYYDREDSEFRKEWNTKRQQLPEAIHIEFSLGPSEIPFEYSMTMPMPKSTL